MTAKSKKIFIIGLLVISTISLSSAYGDGLAEYPFHNDCPLTDVSGNSHDGTCNGGITTGAQGIDKNEGDWDYDDDGSFEAYSFDGTDDYVNAGSSLDSIFDGDFTVNYWVNHDSISSGGYSYHFSKWYDGSNIFFRVGVDDNNDYQLQYSTDGSDSPFISAGSATTSQWDMITVVHDSTDGITMYVNGVEEASTTETLASPNNADLYIGADNNGPEDKRHTDGQLDEARVFGQTLNSTEIGNLYDYNGLSEPDSGSPPSLSNPNPSDGATEVSTDTSLSIDYSESEGNEGNVSFYWPNDTLIEEVQNVASGTTASTSSLDLDSSTSYEWYAVANDSQGETSTTDTFSFETEFVIVNPKYSNDCLLGFNFNESSEPALDECRSNDGDWHGSPTTQVSGVEKTNGYWSDGLAYSFDGTDDLIEVSDSSSLSLNSNEDNYSINFWLKTTDNSEYRYYATKWNGSEGYPFKFANGENGDRLKFQVYDGSNSDLVNITNTIDDGNWHMVTGTVNSGTNELSLYVDGQLEGSTSLTIGDASDSGSIQLMARENITDNIGDGYTDGDMDEFRILDKSLNSTEVSNLYQYNTIDSTSINASEVSLVSPNDGNTVNSSVNFTYKPIDFDSVDGATLTLQNESEDLKIGIISDPHWTDTGRANFPEESEMKDVFNNFANEMNSYNPDIVFQLGDWADSQPTSNFDIDDAGRVSTQTYLNWYGNATAYSAGNISAPMYGVLGNHEYMQIACGSNTESGLIQEFRDNGGNFPGANYTVTKKGYKFVVMRQPLEEGCPSSSSGTREEDSHYYTQEQVDWFNETLRSTDKPTVLIEHVPSFTHDGNNDYGNVKEQSEIRQIASNDDSFVGAFVGHLHFDKDYSFKKTEEGLDYFHTATPWTPNNTWTKVDVDPVNDSYSVSNSSYVGGTWTQDHVDVSVQDYSVFSKQNVSDVVIGEDNDIEYDFPSPGWYRWNVKVQGNDSNIFASNDFTVNANYTEIDTTPPSITIESPLNQTYNTNSTDLNVTSSEAVSTWEYELDGNGTNITFSPNITLTGLSDGSHTVDVYATDSSGNTGSESVTFTVDATDSTPPTSSDNWTVTDYVDKSSTVVELSASDSSGIDSLCWKVQAPNEVNNYQCTNQSSKEVFIDTYGENQIFWYAEDGAGNTGYGDTVEVKLGNTLPDSVLLSPVDGSSDVSLDRDSSVTVDYRPADYDGDGATSAAGPNSTYSLHWQSNDSQISSYSTNWYVEQNRISTYGFENQSFTVDNLEPNTEYSLYIKTEDNRTDYNNFTFTTTDVQDSTAALVSPPDGSSFLDTETVNFEYNGSFRYSGDLELEIDNSVVKSTSVSANTSTVQSYSTSSLDVGSHSFQAVYRDSQGVIASSETRSLEIVNESETTAEKTILKSCDSSADTFCLENGSSPVKFENGFTPEDNTTVEWTVNATGGEGETFTFYSFANSTGGSVGEIQASMFNVTVNSTSNPNSPPTASFTVDPGTPEAGESVSFDGSGSSDSDGSIASYSWSFGDGDSGSGETTSHTYSSSGDYTVELTVTDDDGATDSATTTLTVESSSSGGGGDSGGDDGTGSDPGDNTTSSTTNLAGSTAKLLTPHIGARYGGSVLPVLENNTDPITITAEGNEVSLFINKIFNTTHAEATIDGQTEIIREDDQVGPNGNIRIGDVLPIEPDDGLVYFAQYPTYGGSSEVPLNANYSLQEDVTINLQYREGGVGNSWQTVDTKSPGAGASGFIGDTPSISDSGIYEARVQLSNGSETVNGAPAGFYIGQVPDLNVIEPENGDKYIRKVNPEVQIPLTYKATTFNDTVFTPYYKSGGQIFDTASVFDTQVSDDGIDTADILQFLNPLSFYNQISEFLTGETLFTTVPDETTITQAVNVTVSGDSGSYTAYVNATRNDSNIGFNTTSLGKTAKLVIVGIDNESYQEDRVKKVESDTDDKVNTQPHINNSVDVEKDFNPNSSGNETFRDPYFWPLSPSNGSIKQLLRLSEDKVDLYFDMGHNGSAQLNRTLTLKKDGKDVVSYYLVNTKTSYKVSVNPADLPNGSWENRGNYTWYGEFRDRNGSIVYSTENKVNGSSTFQVKQQVLSSSLVPECFIEGKLHKCSTDTKNTSSAVMLVLLAFALVSKDWGRSMVGGYTWLAGIMSLAYFNWLPTVWGMLALLLAGVMTAGWLVRQFG